MCEDSRTSNTAKGPDRIRLDMVFRWIVAASFLTAQCLGLTADGTFEGKLVETPAREQAAPGWIFIQARNHVLRRVEVAHAAIFRGRQGDRRQRRCNMDCLAVGQDILILAEQDSSGEWHAKRVEILWPGQGSINNGVIPNRFSGEGPCVLPGIFKILRNTRALGLSPSG